MVDKNTNTDVVKQRYNRNAGLFELMDGKMMVQWRKDMLAQVRGNVLEVGVGTGSNLAYYPKEVNLTGIDFSRRMLDYAAKRALLLERNAYLLEMDVEHLNFPDHTFDHVVATCVFCSVPDPIAGLKEMLRVCKPHGKVLLLEHMRSENPVLGKCMDWLNPMIVRLTGANINRRTLQNIDAAGFSIEKNERMFYTIVRRLTLSPAQVEEKTEPFINQ